MLAWVIAASAVLVVVLLAGLRRSFTRVRGDFRESAARQLDAAPPARWIIGGMMGSGKTTFARSLAASLRVPHIEIDLHPSEDEIARQVGACAMGWVAEANPWQIPPRIATQADALVFLDYDNVVNYVRLLGRGWQEWRRRRFSPAGFKAAIVDKALLDLGRIVYRYGRSNREKWRSAGLFAEVDPATNACFRCVSPAELRILAELVAARDPNAARASSANA
jgi:hypothetical protein